MDQNAAFGDKIQSKHARDNQQGKLRTEGAPQGSRRGNIIRKAAHHSANHFPPASTLQDRNDGMKLPQSHRGNIGFTSHVGGISCLASGEDRYGSTGTHLGVPGLTSSQAQAFRSMPTTFSVHPCSHQQTGNSSLIPLSMTGLSAHPNSQYRGSGLSEPPRVSSPLGTACMDLGHDVGMGLNSRSWHEHHANDLPYQQFSTLRQRGGSAVGTQLFYRPTTVQTTPSVLQVLPNTVTKEAQLPEISSLLGISFQTAQPFQSSPLEYIYNHHTPISSSDLKLLTLHPSEVVHTVLGGSFGLMYVSFLDKLTVPREKLEEHRYRISVLTKSELRNKRRCLTCGKYRGKNRKGQSLVKNLSCKATTSTKQLSTRRQKQNSTPGDPGIKSAMKKPKAIRSKSPAPTLECSFHRGNRITVYPTKLGSEAGQSAKPYKYWSCCKGMTNPQPCAGNESHIFPKDNLATLTAQWQYHLTPPVPLESRGASRVAVALDCEMGVSETKNPELIRVTMIDYFTTETLIDKLVYPNVPMKHLSTPFSGVTWDMLNTASARGECFQGRVAALEEIWKFVGPDTIVVTHSGNNDLSSLRWVHHRIVDTYLIDAIPERERLRKLKELENQEKEANTMKSHSVKLEQCVDTTTNSGMDMPYSSSQSEQNNSEIPQVKRTSLKLKVLIKDRLGRDIQTGKDGHDSLEDAVAARDLAHWHVRRLLEGDRQG